MAEVGGRICNVGNLGPAADANETSLPVIYVQLTDVGTPPAWSTQGQWFYAADVAKREILAVALMARSLNRQVSVEVELPITANNQAPYTAIYRMYLL
jgi:hypothetical protein